MPLVNKLNYKQYVGGIQIHVILVPAINVFESLPASFSLVVPINEHLMISYRVYCGTYNTSTTRPVQLLSAAVEWLNKENDEMKCPRNIDCRYWIVILSLSNEI